MDRFMPIYSPLAKKRSNQKVIKVQIQNDKLSINRCVQDTCLLFHTRYLYCSHPQYIGTTNSLLHRFKLKLAFHGHNKILELSSFISAKPTDIDLSWIHSYRKIQQAVFLKASSFKNYLLCSVPSYNKFIMQTAHLISQQDPQPLFCWVNIHCLQVVSIFYVDASKWMQVI